MPEKPTFEFPRRQTVRVELGDPRHLRVPRDHLLRVLFWIILLGTLPAAGAYFEGTAGFWFALPFFVVPSVILVLVYGSPNRKAAVASLDVNNFYPRWYLYAMAVFWLLVISVVIWLLALRLPG